MAVAGATAAPVCLWLLHLHHWHAKRTRRRPRPPALLATAAAVLRAGATAHFPVLPLSGSTGLREALMSAPQSVSRMQTNSCD